MSKNAQNLIEVLLIAGVIAVVAVSVNTIFNNQKQNLSKNSAVTLRTETAGKSAAPAVKK